MFRWVIAYKMTITPQELLQLLYIMIRVYNIDLVIDGAYIGNGWNEPSIIPSVLSKDASVEFINRLARQGGTTKSKEQSWKLMKTQMRTSRVNPMQKITADSTHRPDLIGRTALSIITRQMRRRKKTLITEQDIVAKEASSSLRVWWVYFSIPRTPYTWVGQNSRDKPVHETGKSHEYFHDDQAWCQIASHNCETLFL